MLELQDLYFEHFFLAVLSLYQQVLLLLFLFLFLVDLFHNFDKIHNSYYNLKKILFQIHYHHLYMVLQNYELNIMLSLFYLLIYIFLFVAIYLFYNYVDIFYNTLILPLFLYTFQPSSMILKNSYYLSFFRNINIFCCWYLWQPWHCHYFSSIYNNKTCS